MLVALALSSPQADRVARDRGATVRYLPPLRQEPDPMILESADAPTEASSGTEGQVPAPQIPSHGPAGEQAQAGRQEAAVQLERDYPGYHVWTSDGGWWYATRTHS